MDIASENVEPIKKYKERNTAIELLRIIAMLMILFHHFAVHGGFTFSTTELSVNHFWYYFLTMGGKVGVNIFVLISGYFLINSNRGLFNFKRILKLWGQILFYSIGIYLLFLVFANEPFSFTSFIKNLLPITFEKYWFASTYLILYLLYPFINLLLHKFDKKTYQIFLILLFVIWCIFVTFTSKGFQSNDLLWFVFLYSLAGYIQLYGLNPKLKSKHYFWLFLVSAIITFLSCIIFTLLGTKVSLFASHATYFFEINKLPTFVVSLMLFMLFANLKMKNLKWINIISSATFGVYLIHEHNLVRPFLWETLFKNASYQGSSLLIPYSIGICLLIFICCIVIDLIRIYTIEKGYMYLVDKAVDKVKFPFKKIINIFRRIIFGND